MNLGIINLQKKIPIEKRKIKKKLTRILLLQNKKNVDLSIVFVNDKTIKKINKKFLQKNFPTDVLAFDLKDSKLNKKSVKGEIIISLDTAARNAKKYKTSLYSEAMLYLIHGVLHLCGFADKTKKETNRMRKREKYLLKRII